VTPNGKVIDGDTLYIPFFTRSTTGKSVIQMVMECKTRCTKDYGSANTYVFVRKNEIGIMAVPTILSEFVEVLYEY
jgi:hypothetical protein